MVTPDSSSPCFAESRHPNEICRRATCRRTLTGVWSQRSVIDYALARRSTLESLRRGGTTTTDVCDADPYLLRAAKFHGEPTDTPCPICRKPLTTLNYTFGDVLGQYSGRIKATRELEPMAREHEEFRVYVVEVCCTCSWNHLRRSYVLGDGVPRGRARRRAAEE
jgi:Family of unknown function (DUF5318)